jgi:uncharacterized protein (TIGR00661 family)
MKIFYAVQATGNGHISRAIQLMPYLQQFGQVDVFLSGANSTLNPPFPVKFRSRGLSLFYSRRGGLDYVRMWKENSLIRALREARHLPLEGYDVILNDFEFITARSCRMKGLPSVQFGHQASFMSPHTPRPSARSLPGELILKRYAPATHYVGLHFQRYDHFIFPPVIKECFLKAQPVDKGHITVYLSAYESHCIEPHFAALPHISFQWFLKGIEREEQVGNIRFFPVSDELFNKSLIESHGIITGAGFEAPAEALYLGKRLMCIPIRGQYEQLCNAAALAPMGVKIVSDADTPFFSGEVNTWLNEPCPPAGLKPNNLSETLDYIFSMGPWGENGKNTMPLPQTVTDQ